jgi:D-alanine-D-alanine ligase
MNKKIRVAVLVGGPSSEYEISLQSGAQVLANLDTAKYRARSIRISKFGRWPISFKKIKKNFDVCFIAMHGEYGEDGTVQSALERCSIPFTGSGSAASRLGMDKIASAEIFKKAGLFVPPKAVKFPMVVKPADRGSSAGVSIAGNKSELAEALKKALKYSGNILVQKRLLGREFTCGVIERRGKIIALPPTEIIPDAKFFDYRAKYAGASQEITPPKLPKSQIKKIQNTALTAHKAIGASGLSRTDMILDKKDNLYVLEINTIPGMTQASLLPQQARAAGISFSQLLDIIIDAAMV